MVRRFEKPSSSLELTLIGLVLFAVATPLVLYVRVHAFVALLLTSLWVAVGFLVVLVLSALF